LRTDAIATSMDSMELRLVTDSNAPGGIADDEALRSALDASGMEWECAVWNDPTVVWEQAPLTLLRTPWDYPEHLSAFLAWADDLRTRTRLLNPAEVLWWNIHKGYLLALERAGVPIVPTRLVEREAPDLEGVRRHLEQAGAAQVVKPAVGAGARGTLWFDPGHSAAAFAHVQNLLEHGDVLIQPAMAEITTAGEISFLYLDGVFTHAVRKFPGSGDFRVQERHGGSVKAIEATLQSRSVADLAYAQASELLHTPLAYARVDLVETAAGPQLMELELIEPELFLRFHAPAAQTLVDGLTRELRV
jgi:glutathione synthase/RimK-type ligase-like ATP-grasp enzyme